MSDPIFRILGEEPNLEVVQLFLERCQWGDKIDLVARAGKKQRVIASLDSETGSLKIVKAACNELNIRF